MREQNFCFPEQQRACLTITPSLYDRRALDCTAPLPLLTSLMHLSLMTSSSQRVREALSVDGGLERLTHILETTSRSDYPDRRSAWRWILAYHCLVNVGVRGSEQIRARVERSGGVRIIIHVLESYLKTLESVRMAREPAARNQVDPTSLSASTSSAHDINANPFGHSTRHTSSSAADTLDEPPFREEDILLALQLLAYLSKHPSIRDRLHANYPINVFTLVERFCARYHSNTIHLWAGVVMRNGCRKDDTRGGLRRCAYLHCGRWESRPHEFAKCRRCRKAKYCSKQCQSHAWADGHRYWCVPRQPTSTTTASATATAAAASNTTATTTTSSTTTIINANAANNIVNTDDDDEDDLMEAQSTRVDVTSRVTSLTTSHRASAVMAATTGTSSSIHATHGDLSADDELSATERGAFHTSAISLS
ncbi:hypothetical protein BDF22DRAFT_622198 [Syncephalis plumigaleata]|nr:hypothetical protein BDF22DRAFT_622198 [Syncephalis plumigaleata]